MKFVQRVVEAFFRAVADDAKATKLRELGRDPEVRRLYAKAVAVRSELIRHIEDSLTPEEREEYDKLQSEDRILNHERWRLTDLSDSGKGNKLKAEEDDE